MTRTDNVKRGLTDTSDLTAYFRQYNRQHPVMVLRCDSVQAKESIRHAALVAGLPMQHFVFDRLVLRLVDEAMEDGDENLD
jgi:hypothetical protein